MKKINKETVENYIAARNQHDGYMELMRANPKSPVNHSWLERLRDAVAATSGIRVWRIGAGQS